MQLGDQNRKRYCFTQRISSGDGVTTGIIVETLYTVKETANRGGEEDKEAER